MEDLSLHFEDLNEIVGGGRKGGEADTYTVFADGKPCQMDGCDPLPCAGFASAN